jgi:hypothetical protein
MDEGQFQDLLDTLKAIAAALQRAYPRSAFEYDTVRAETEEALFAEPNRRALLRRPRREM